MSGKISLILLPGLLCDADLWAHQTAHLGEVADVRVADLTGADDMRGLADAVLASAPDRFALAGLSMGGYVAQQIMRQAPERVVKLALLDTNARADGPEQREARQGFMRLTEEGRFDSVQPRLMPMLLHPDRMGDADLTGRLKTMARRIGPEAFLRQQRAIMNRPDGRGDLPKIACPTLVLGGRQDKLCPVEIHAEMADAIPRARLAVVEDCGHMSPMERPRAVTALLRDWLIYA